jgi:hypothetical protein
VCHFARQPSLAFSQRGLSLLDLRDVPRNFGASDNQARVIPQRRNGQCDINASTGFGHPGRLIVFDSLTSPEASQDVVFLLVQLWRNDHRDRVADGLLLRVPEHPLSSGVPR